jgi:transposase-like protein
MDKYKISARALRRIRQTIYDYDHTAKEVKSARVLRYLKSRVMRDSVMKETGYARVMWM